MTILMLANTIAGSLTICVFYAALTFCLKMKKSRTRLLIPLMLYLTVLSFFKMYTYESSFTAIPTLLCNVVLIYFIARYSAATFTETLITGVSGILFCLIFPDIICSVIVQIFFPGVFDRNPNHLGTTAVVFATNGLAICFSILFCFIVQKIKKAKRTSFLLYVFFAVTLLFLSQEFSIGFAYIISGGKSAVTIVAASLLFCFENIFLAYFLLSEFEKYRKEQLQFQMETEANEASFFVDKHELTDREMAKIRHDLRNQMSTVQILLTSNKTGNAAELAAEIMEQFSRSGSTSKK